MFLNKACLPCINWASLPWTSTTDPRIEAGLALSKLVPKLETGSRILDKNEFQVSKTSVDTSIDNLKRKGISLSYRPQP